MKKTMLICAAFVLAVLTAWTVWANKALQINTVKVKNDSLPEKFIGCRIAHISDLHNAQIGKENEKLLAMLKSAEPDMIVITGDVVDSRHTDIDVAISFAEKAVKIASCYYITGNHEARMPEYAEIKKAFIEAGVVVLDDEAVKLERSGETVTLIGVNDPAFKSDDISVSPKEKMSNTLKKLTEETDGYTILLSHRPELIDAYAEYGVDLALCGHAHGGQVRIPFAGGMYAPGQGLFPKYDSGLYTKNDTTMVVSRGIGNSGFPLRFNNRPEIVLIELGKE